MFVSVSHYAALSKTASVHDNVLVNCGNLLFVDSPMK